MFCIYFYLRIILLGFVLGWYPTCERKHLAFGFQKECKSSDHKGTCTPMYIVALFTIAKLWKQPRCPTTDDCIKKMWYLLFTIKKNENSSCASKWMELENIILSKKFLF
jgi:hypothetical protein